MNNAQELQAKISFLISLGNETLGTMFEINVEKMVKFGTPDTTWGTVSNGYEKCDLSKIPIDSHNAYASHWNECKHWAKQILVFVVELQKLQTESEMQAGEILANRIQEMWDADCANFNFAKDGANKKMFAKTKQWICEIEKKLQGLDSFGYKYIGDQNKNKLRVMQNIVDKNNQLENKKAKLQAELQNAKNRGLKQIWASDGNLYKL